MALKVTKTNHVPSFLAMAMMEATRIVEATGTDVIHLEVGQPSTLPPAAVNNALIGALSNVSTHSYSVAFGQIALRDRIAAHYQDWYGVRPDTGRIAVTPGSSLGFAIAFLGAFDRGDKIAIADPGYPAYRNLLNALGLQPVLLPSRATEGWMPQLQTLQESGDLPDGLLLASPANPTGVVMKDEEIIAIAKWCDVNGVRLIMDEIYHGLTFNGRSTSALCHSNSAIVVNSFSKYFCMTGWRIGWCILPDDLVEICERLAQNMYISPARPMQEGAMAAFDNYDELDAHALRYRENRDILLHGLPEEFLGEAAPSDGAFYLYTDISNLASGRANSLEMTTAMLEEAHVATTSGLDFDQEQGRHHIRLSYAGTTADMKEASRRINSWLPRYLKRLEGR